MFNNDKSGNVSSVFIIIIIISRLLKVDKRNHNTMRKKKEIDMLNK